MEDGKEATALDSDWVLEHAAQVLRNVVGARVDVDLGDGRLAHVDEHVRVRDLGQLPLRRVARVLLLLGAAAPAAALGRAGAAT